MRIDEIHVGRTYKGTGIATAKVTWIGRKNLRCFDPNDEREFQIAISAFAVWAQSVVPEEQADEN